jgi:hypothetical protein
MWRRALIALLFLAVAGAGWLAAHSAAYVLAVPHAHDRAELLAATGHGYLAYAPLFAACGPVLIVAGVLACMGEGLCARSESRPPAFLFVLTPPLAFVLLEHVERLVAYGAVPYGVALEGTFLIGLALQLPFAVAAFGLVRSLQRLGHALGRVLRSSLGLSRRLRPDPLVSGVVGVGLEPDLPSSSVLALGHGQRAPPVLVGT